MLKRENISIKLIFIAFQTVFPFFLPVVKGELLRLVTGWASLTMPPRRHFLFEKRHPNVKTKLSLGFGIVPHKTMVMTLDKVLRKLSDSIWD